ncbi:MAG: hypothetical protein COT81_02060 [Candidatus Buchananbacteria bacterium CG10_big_fil_rev_8_21_14_0_10_42_9]|uniref:Thioredoxin domain-containing protein n=1 Tax=Candidatus Buchananbacteria bacterium CG10_big_fil_rev_8_21_14_0_10_42_9 TaxID=1974526 RepID=A0A2H0W1M4_9BACT|nr:MAG: hypothetical protein COT81_02060 [Candidatus Buchananbacteria bacterium CG10_big_fil_rev_8_21_14_0_10_42_9]
MKYGISLAVLIAVLGGAYFIFISSHDQDNPGTNMASDQSHRQDNSDMVNSNPDGAGDSSSQLMVDKNATTENEDVVLEKEPGDNTLEETVVTDSIVSPNNTTPDPAVDYNQTVPVTSVNYQRYNEADYQAALTSGQPVLLYFTASWCPTCRRQNPVVNELFGTDADVLSWGVQGFFVHYNDPETNSEDQALAKEFGVTYQHTFFVINGSAQNKFIGHQTTSQLKSQISSIL